MEPRRGKEVEVHKTKPRQFRSCVRIKQVSKKQIRQSTCQVSDQLDNHNLSRKVRIKSVLISFITVKSNVPQIILK